MDWLTNFLGTLFGIGQMQETLLGVTGTETVAGELSEIYGDEGILGAAIEQQEQAGQIGAGAATQVGTPPPGAGPQPSTYLTGFLGDIQSGEMDLTRPSITKPKKTSTEFVENIQDQLAQQTAGLTQDMARTGKFSGIKDVLGATDQAMITAQEKGAAMDQAYQKQLTDIEKFEAGQLSDIEKFEFGQESAVTQALAGQDFAGQQDWYDLADDVLGTGAYVFPTDIAAVTTGPTVLTVYPGLSSEATKVCNGILPQVFRAHATVAGSSSPSFTFSLAVELID